MVSDIFSPSDPVMILASQKSRPRVESELKSIQELEVRARKLSANFTSSFPKLVDITKEGKADGKDLLKPVIEHQQNAAIFGKECSMLQNSINEIRSNLCIPEIVKYEDFGRIELPVAKGFPSQPNRTINLLDLDQLKLVHHALII